MSWTLQRRKLDLVAKVTLTPLEFKDLWHSLKTPIAEELAEELKTGKFSQRSGLASRSLTFASLLLHSWSQCGFVGIYTCRSRQEEGQGP